MSKEERKENNSQVTTQLKRKNFDNHSSSSSRDSSSSEPSSSKIPKNSTAEIIPELKKKLDLLHSKFKDVYKKDDLVIRSNKSIEDSDAEDIITENEVKEVFTFIKDNWNDPIKYYLLGYNNNGFNLLHYYMYALGVDNALGLIIDKFGDEELQILCASKIEDTNLTPLMLSILNFKNHIIFKNKFSKYERIFSKLLNNTNLKEKIECPRPDDEDYDEYNDILEINFFEYCIATGAEDLIKYMLDNKEFTLTEILKFIIDSHNHLTENEYSIGLLTGEYNFILPSSLYEVLSIIKEYKEKESHKNEDIAALQLKLIETINHSYEYPKKDIANAMEALDFYTEAAKEILNNSLPSDDEEEEDDGEEDDEDDNKKTSDQYEQNENEPEVDDNLSEKPLAGESPPPSEHES